MMKFMTILENMFDLEEAKSKTAQAAEDAGLFNGGKGRWYSGEPGDPNRKFVAVSQGGELVWIDDAENVPAGAQTITRDQAMGKPSAMGGVDQMDAAAGGAPLTNKPLPISMKDSEFYRRMLTKKVMGGSDTAKLKLQSLLAMDKETEDRADVISQHVDAQQAHKKSKYADKYPSPQI
jgi:hypothetical protein